MTIATKLVSNLTFNVDLPKISKATQGIKNVNTEANKTNQIKPLDKFKGELKSVIGITAKVTAGITAITGVVNTLAIAGLKSSNQINKLSKETGLTVQQVQKLQFVAGGLGLSGEGIVTSIGNLNTKIGEAAQNGSEDFARLGISVTDTNGKVKGGLQVLNEVKNSFGRLNLSFAERKSFAEKLGLDGEAIQLLNSSGKELDKINSRFDQFGKVTDDGLKNIKSFNLSFDVLSQGFFSVGRQIGASLAPQLTELVESFTNLLVKNKDWIINGISATIKTINNLMPNIKRVVAILGILGGIFLALKIYTLGWAGAIAIASGALAILTAPITLVVAGVVALVLIVEDLWVAFNGGDSVLQGWYNSVIKFIKPAVDYIKNAFTQLSEFLSNIFTSIFPEFVTDFFKGGSNINIPNPSKNIANNSSTANNVNIEVKSDNPERAGQAVMTQFQKQLGQVKQEQRFNL